jgi:hypothetical protein
MRIIEINGILMGSTCCMSLGEENLGIIAEL